MTENNKNTDNVEEQFSDRQNQENTNSENSDLNQSEKTAATQNQASDQNQTNDQEENQSSSEQTQNIDDSKGSGDSTEEQSDHLADLKRLQAEYVNYRKRVERDRNVAREAGIESVAMALLPVLDDIEAARQHGDLEDGPFASIAQKLDETLEKQGIQRYGQAGDEFDPTIYEALMQQPSSEVSTETVSQVLRSGYKKNDKVIRPAQVSVEVPETEES